MKDDAPMEQAIGFMIQRRGVTVSREERREEKPTDTATGADTWEKSGAATDGYCKERGHTELSDPKGGISWYQHG